MLNLSDKELDRLSREAAEKYEVEQDPAAWHKLEQLLERELGRSSPIPRFSKPGMPFLYTPAVILLIGATYFLLKPTKHTPTSTQKNYSSIITPAQGNKNKPDVSSPGSVTSIDNTGIKPDEVQKNNNAFTKARDTHSHPAQTETANAGREKNETTSAIAENTLPGSLAGNRKKNIEKTAETNPVERRSENNTDNKTTTNNRPSNHLQNEDYLSAAHPAIHDHDKKHHLKNLQQKDIPNKDAHAAEINNVALFPIAERSTDNNNTQNIAELKPASTVGLQPLFNNTGYPVANSVRMKTGDIQQDIITPGKKNRERTAYTNRSFEVGLLLSPDFSEVKYNYNNKIGSNIGITLSYQLSGRFSVNTGFIYTIKNYDARGYDFHAPPGYIPIIYHLDFVEGNCHMFEIPLNLRYDFNKTGNTSFFISSGLSSYLMKKENYTFYFHNYNIGFAGRDDQTLDMSHSYWLSALNLSAGFETKISNSLSIQAEPYIKLPLTGIGLGKVDLSSYGISFQLKYAPVLKRTRR